MMRKINANRKIYSVMLAAAMSFQIFGSAAYASSDMSALPVQEMPEEAQTVETVPAETVDTEDISIEEVQPDPVYTEEPVQDAGSLPEPVPAAENTTEVSGSVTGASECSPGEQFETLAGSESVPVTETGSGSEGQADETEAASETSSVSEVTPEDEGPSEEDMYKLFYEAGLDTEQIRALEPSFTLPDEAQEEALSTALAMMYEDVESVTVGCISDTALDGYVQFFRTDEMLREAPDRHIFLEKEGKLKEIRYWEPNDAVFFEAGRYILADMKRTETAYDLYAEGEGYSVTVNFTTGSKLPSDTVLKAEEITSDDPSYEGYAVLAKEAAGGEEGSRVRLFDISLVSSADGTEYRPDAGVSVTINTYGLETETADGAGTETEEIKEAPAVVHIDEKGAELISSETNGDVTEFTAESFSVYAIVRGPSVYVPVAEDAQTLEDLTGEKAAKGIILSLDRVGGVFYVTGSINTAATRQVLYENADISAAAAWFFEPAEGANLYRIYTVTDEGPKYITNHSGNYISLTDNGTVFNVTQPETGKYVIKHATANKWLQHSNGGNGIRMYTDANNAANTRFAVTYVSSLTVPDDEYALNGRTVGIINRADSLSGYAFMGETKTASALGSLALTVRTSTTNATETVYIAKDSNITQWTFHSVEEDRYLVSANTPDGIRYLKAGNGTLQLVGEDEASEFRFIPGTGEHEGQFRLVAGNYAVSCESANGFKAVYDSPDKEKLWLDFAELSDLTEDDFVVYSAQKVSVSDPAVTNGSRVIVYTRRWNNSTKKYEFYAINHDGQTVRCFESGDSIQWVGSKINTMLWNFTEYYWEGTNDPNFYYELKNPYSGKFLAPQINEGQILSDEPIGINMNGRRYGDYYSKIIAWDDAYYAYAGIKTDTDGRIISVPMTQAEDFYFAVMQDLPPEGELTTVPTVDHTQYGITMKLIDFGNTNTRQNNLLDNYMYDKNGETPGLLSTDLKENGYPMAANGSLYELFANAQEVNHLFVSSTYNGSGYYEYDSTQNYASLKTDGSNEFTVYKEIGTHDASNKPSLKHGQFFPFNDLEPGVFASINDENLYDAIVNPLSDADPRKHEKLYLIRNPDYYFGVEIEASFVQTPSGLDAWGHDIIYEFTGDDDFWLYVDGELVIDLGGIHSALPGTVNYSTGEVNVNGKPTTLREIFRSNYESRGMSQEQIAVKLDEIFEQNEHGQYIFKDYSTHKMKLFFMERGAQASNLHMRFNLSSVNPGQIILQKTISGTDKTDYKLAEYPYQIYYRLTDGEQYHRLGRHDSNDRITVTYQNSSVPVKYAEHFTPAGGSVVYDDVFFLTPGQVAVVAIPDDAISYYVVECGVNSQVYDEVRINDTLMTGTPTADSNRFDYASVPAEVSETPHIVFDNHVDETALRTLTVTKRLYDINDNEITDDPTGFSFRLYLGNENETSLNTASLQDYQVRDPAGYYCRWDAQTQGFVPTGYNSFDAVPDAEKDALTFQTSFNGAISKIPATYRVEVRDLFVGTRFKIEERASEIPAGYSFIRYERDAASYIVAAGDTVNSGTIRDSDSPAVEILNRRGFGLTVKKKWSDKDYVSSHGSIYTAVYVNGTLLPGSVRQISHPKTSAYYYWDALLPGTLIGDYAIKEVRLSGEFTADENGVVTGGAGFTVTPLEEGQTLSVSAVMKDTGITDTYDYKVSYETGPVTGYAFNTRTDTVTNSRHGIRLIKQTADGEPLAGAVFTLTGPNGAPVGNSSYTSDTDGLITIAYINTNDVYTLAESSAPHGYYALENAVMFRVTGSGNLEIISGDPDCCEAVQALSGDMPSLIVKNRPVVFKVYKEGVDTENVTSPLSGVHFALHKEVSVDNVTMMDYTPITGYEDLVSGADGKIPSVDETLPAGTYYLRETRDVKDYQPIEQPIRFTVTVRGEIELTPHDDARLEDGIGQDGEKIYVMTVTNRMMSVVAPSGLSFPMLPFVLTAVICVAVLLVFLSKREEYD